MKRPRGYSRLCASYAAVPSSPLFMHTHTCMHAAESTYARAQAWQQQQEKAEGAAEQSDKLKEGWRVLVQGRRMGMRGVFQRENSSAELREF